MTIIDQYIFDHQKHMNSRKMADRLGVSVDLVRYRKRRLQYQASNSVYVAPITPQDDIYALVQFILKRKSGVLVEIAERRIIDINKTLNY